MNKAHRAHAAPAQGRDPVSAIVLDDEGVPSSRREMIFWLRRCGFTRDWRSKDVLEYRAEVSDRVYRVQFWSDGRHRVSFARLTGKGEHETNLPREFRSINGMWRAIAILGLTEWAPPALRLRLA